MEDTLKVLMIVDLIVLLALTIDYLKKQEGLRWN